MNRRYTREEYRALCDRIRKRFPDAAITTDFMVGFPGETDADFADSLEFVRSIGFAAIHVFRYSVRPGTKAAEFPDKVPDSVKTQRMKLAQSVADAAKAAFLQSQIGKTASVLFERERGDGFHIGHAPNGTIVRVSVKNLKNSLRNQIFYAKIEESDATCCYGTFITADANP
jgi:threonylcarbamoyladenosine tRNA methylthiotransferase MtaB